MDIFCRENLRFCKRSGEKHYTIMLYCNKNKRFIVIGNVSHDGMILNPCMAKQQSKYDAEDEETGRTGAKTLYLMHRNVEGITDAMKDEFLSKMTSVYKANTVNKLKKKRFASASLSE